MAIRNNQERGSRRAARRRVGTDFEAFDGMDLESDPGSIAKNAFRHLENVDFRGEMRARGGAQLLNEDTFEGCQQFLSDYQPSAHRLYFTFIGCTDVSEDGRSIVWYDPDFSGQLQRMLYFPWVTSSAVLGIYGDNLFLGVDSFLKQLHLLQPISGEDPLASSGQTQDTVVASLNGFTIRSLGEFDALLFVGAENVFSPTSGDNIYTWDGTTLRLDKSATVVPTRMIQFRENLALGYATDKFSLRTPAGVYSDIAHAGTIATVDMVSHNDNLYIADGDANIWKYDGTTLSVWHTIAGADINSVESFNGFLWYVYQTSGNVAYLGRWSEASVFNDTYFNFTAQDPDVTDVTFVRAYRNKLYAISSGTNATSMMVF